MEEWNEYGELKENVGTGPIAPSSSTPSAPSTPSKAPKNADSPSTAQLSAATPPRPLQPLTTDSPLTTAMRQAGLEAARKAGDAKSQARVKIAGSKNPNDAMKKLDYSALSTPSGTTEESSAKAPETGSAAVRSKANTVPVTTAIDGKNIEQSRNLPAGRSKAGELEDEEPIDPSSEVGKEEARNPRIAPEKHSGADAKISEEEEEPESTTKLKSQETKPDAGDIDTVKSFKE